MKKILVILLVVIVCGLTWYFLPSITKKENAELSNTQAAEAGEVRVSHILVEKEADAIKIRKEIVEGKKDFYEEAKKYSICPSSENGGDLGYFAHGVMVPEFDKVAFSTPVGQISQPVKTKFGWHLIYVIAKR